MQVRQFQGDSDVPGIKRVHGLSWRAAYDEILPTEVLEDVTVELSDEEFQKWAERFRANEEGILVAEDIDGAIRGFADFRWGDADMDDFVGEDEAQLKAIYVHPDYWGQGIGSTLLNTGLEHLPSNVDAVQLSVFTDNEIGREFYETHNFEPTDEIEVEIDGTDYQSTVYTLQL